MRQHRQRDVLGDVRLGAERLAALRAQRGGRGARCVADGADPRVSIARGRWWSWRREARSPETNIDAANAEHHGPSLRPDGPGRRDERVALALAHY